MYPLLHIMYHTGRRTYRDSRGLYGEILEAIVVYWGYLGIMENKMETAILYRDPTPRVSVGGWSA